MIFVYIVFAWLIIMIVYNIWTGKKEEEQMTISKEKMKKYFAGRFIWK
jgi:hypothetical protein